MENPQWQPIDPDHKATLDRLLLEKIPLAGIACALQLSEAWLQSYVNRCYQAVPRQVQVQPKAKGQLTVQRDELWSFVRRCRWSELYVERRGMSPLLNPN